MPRRRELIYRRVPKPIMSNIKNPVIRRMALRIGISRLSRDAYDKIKDITEMQLRNIVGRIVDFAEYRKLTTITYKDVIYVLKNHYSIV